MRGICTFPTNKIRYWDKIWVNVWILSNVTHLITQTCTPVVIIVFYELFYLNETMGSSSSQLCIKITFYSALLFWWLIIWPTVSGKRQYIYQYVLQILQRRYFTKTTMVLICVFVCLVRNKYVIWARNLFQFYQLWGWLCCVNINVAEQTVELPMIGAPWHSCDMAVMKLVTHTRGVLLI